MLDTLEDLGRGLGAFDTVIDVRSPAEFAEDHAPGALNLPVLSDEERAEVGTLYVQHSKFDARRLGAAYIARNVGVHLQGPLRDKPGGWRPLVYCWRGGQRSQSMALILSQVGWRTTVLRGGYRTYRREVVARLYEGAPALEVVLLDGPTGVGKTELLGRLAARGVQVLDLEALAAHRGSLFGEMGGQPSQKLFESRLASALAALDPARPVVVEAESTRIGERFLPPVLWRAMQDGRRIVLDAPAPARAASLLEGDYADLAGDPARLRDLLGRLPGRHGRKRVAEWLEMVERGDLQPLAEALVVEHYDPAYARGRKAQTRPPVLLHHLDEVGPRSWDAAADRIAGAIAVAASQVR